MGLETPRVDSPIEPLVSFVAHCFPNNFKHLCLEAILRKCITQIHVQRQKAVKLAAKTQNDQG